MAVIQFSAIGEAWKETQLKYYTLLSTDTAFQSNQIRFMGRT